MISLTDNEKRMVFQLEGCTRFDALHEIAMLYQYTHDQDKKDLFEKLLKKLRGLTETECRELISDIQKKLPSALYSKNCRGNDCCCPAEIRCSEAGWT